MGINWDKEAVGRLISAMLAAHPELSVSTIFPVIQQCSYNLELPESGSNLVPRSSASSFDFWILIRYFN